MGRVAYPVRLSGGAVTGAVRAADGGSTTEVCGGRSHQGHDGLTGRVRMESQACSCAEAGTNSCFPLV